MSTQWLDQTAAALVGVHLLVIAAVGMAVTLLVSRWRRIRGARVLITRITLAGLSRSPVLRPQVDGHATAGVGAPDPAPAVVPHRVHVEMSGRHRWVA